MATLLIKKLDAASVGTSGYKLLRRTPRDDHLVIKVMNENSDTFRVLDRSLRRVVLDMIVASAGHLHRASLYLQ